MLDSLDSKVLFLVILNILISLLILRYALKSIRPRHGKDTREGKKFSREERIDIIAEAMWKFMERGGTRNYNVALLSAFNVTRSDRKGVIDDIRKFLDKTMFVLSVTPSLFQDFWDQLLKEHADVVQNVYDTEEELEKKYKERKSLRNTMTRDEISKVIERGQSIKAEKKLREDEFWDLFDALEGSGVQVFDRGVAAYVALKPALPTLPQLR